MADFLERIRSAWAAHMALTSRHPWSLRLNSGEMKLAHYKSYLRETFFHAGRNPEIQALATVTFQGPDRNLIKNFYQHAISEIGHDELALSDLTVLGEDPAKVRAGRPLPQTEALIAYGFYQAQYHSPLGYLGYLFHLEYMPTLNGNDYLAALTRLGVPPQALTFIQEHATVDIQHNKLMTRYLETTVRSEADAQVVIDTAKATCTLHCAMIFAAFDRAEALESACRQSA